MVDDSDRTPGDARRVEQLLRTSPLVVIGLDAALRITDWNLKAEATFKIAASDALGRDVASVLAVDGGAAAWRRVLAPDASVVRTTLRRDAEVLVCEWMVQAVDDNGDDGDDGGPPGCVLCHGRIVPADEARAALERVALRTILDSLNIIVWAIDTEGTFVYQEGSGLASFGMKPGQLVGQNVFELYGHIRETEETRDALRGQPAHNTSDNGGISLENWVLPVPEPRTEAAVVAISLNVTEIKRGERELRDKLELIERQQRVIRELGTPIIEVWEGVLTLPIIGLVDSVRTAEIMDNLLSSVARVRARFAILDMTGVEVVDTQTASHLLGLIRAIRLLGAEGIVSGIHPNIARTIVTLGVDLSSIVVHASLRQALKYCITRMNGR